VAFQRFDRQRLLDTFNDAFSKVTEARQRASECNKYQRRVMEQERERERMSKSSVYCDMMGKVVGVQACLILKYANATVVKE
jgi:hypothetical protein